MKKAGDTLRKLISENSYFSFTNQSLSFLTPVAEHPAHEECFILHENRSAKAFLLEKYYLFCALQYK